MKPGDIVFWRDEQFGRHRFWEIQGVYLGCDGQEGLIELKNLTERPGIPGRTGNATTTFVPEPLIRNLNIYTQHVAQQKPSRGCGGNGSMNM